MNRWIEKRGLKKKKGKGKKGNMEEIIPSFHIFQARFCQSIFAFLSLWLPNCNLLFETFDL